MSKTVPCIKPPEETAATCSNLEACRAANSTQPGQLVSIPPTALLMGEGNLTPATPQLPGEPREASRAKHLAKAFHRYHQMHDKHKRQTCIIRARKRYGSKRQAKATRARKARANHYHHRGR